MAFCPNCGSEVKEGMSFCTICGSPLDKATLIYEDSSKTKPKKKKKKHGKFIIFLLILAAILGAAWYFRDNIRELADSTGIGKIGTLQFDAQSFADWSFDGYDTEGFVLLDFDNAGLKEVLWQAIEDKHRDEDIDEEDIADFVHTVSASCDGVMLTNGQTVSFLVEYDEDMAKELKISFTNTTWTDVVDGLEEYTFINPFEYVTVSFDGTAPFGYASMDRLPIDDTIGKLNYEFADDTELDIGDTVILKCKDDPDFFAQRGYKLSPMQNSYVIAEGSIDTYIKDPAELDDSVLKRMKKVAEEKIDAHIDHVEKNTKATASSINYEGAVVMTPRENNQSAPNRVIIVFSVDWSSQDDDSFESCRLYLPYSFEKVIKYKNGTIDYDYKLAKSEFTNRNAFNYRGCNFEGYKDPINLFTELVRNNSEKYTYITDASLESIVN